MTSLIDLFKGCLLGSAAADALGAPLEGSSAAEIRERDGTVTDFIDGRYPAGSVSAATQTAVVMTQALLEMGRFEAPHLRIKLGRMIEYSDDGIKEARGLGLATATAARNLLRGVADDEAAVESGGCGPAARVHPMGLRYFREPKELREFAIEQAGITHAGSEAAASSVCIAFAIAHCVWQRESGEEFEPLTMLEHLYHATYEIDIEFAQKVSGLAEYVDKPAEEGLAYTGTGGYSMEAVPAALLAFLLSPGDLEKTVVTAANAGGCASSIAAMAGAVSGAHNGVGAIPERWLEGLEGREYIEGLATKLKSFVPEKKKVSRPFF